MLMLTTPYRFQGNNICFIRKYKTVNCCDESNIILSLTDRTDCTDSFAHATSTTEMTDFTDFVSIACSLRH